MIDSFTKDFFFLSNFFPCEVVYEGIKYPSSEHAYQASKTLDLDERKRIVALSTASESKKAGRKVVLRDDWEQVKDNVMTNIVSAKFNQNSILKDCLLLTENEELVEGNWWHDTHFGVCNGVGENKLGKILMEVRESLRESSV